MPEHDRGRHDSLPSRADIEATLRDLLIRFQESSDQGAEQIDDFARAGAEAILMQMQHRLWLSTAESAATLGVSEASVCEQVEQHEIPAVRGADQQPRIHRRDLSLYHLSQRLGATEDQVTPLTPPVAWNDELGFDPWHAITPG